MVTLEETLQTPGPTTKCLLPDPPSSPARISFSSELLDDSNFISICPNEQNPKDENDLIVKHMRNPDNFEFLSGSLTDMITADELFREGKLLPFWQTHHTEKLNKITLKTSKNSGPDGSHEEISHTGPPRTCPNDDDERRISWFLDDDPSPRPPKCMVLWKELLRLKKQRASSTLSPSASPSSSSSSSSSGVGENGASSVDKSRKGGGMSNKEKVVNRVKKGLERTRSASIRIRPMVNVPIYTHGTRNNGSALPPLFPARKGRLD